MEVFEVDKPEVPLMDISRRGQVLTGSDVMIGGFVILVGRGDSGPDQEAVPALRACQASSTPRASFRAGSISRSWFGRRAVSSIT